MKIAVIGTGYVGLVTGTCFAETGNTVLCIDVDQEKLNKLKAGIITIYEPGLELIFSRNIKEKRLLFSDSLKEAVDFAEIIFLALPTPPMEDGSADLQYVLNVAKEIAGYMKSYKVIVNKSTVPVGTADKVTEIIKSITNVPFDVASNPEFLREGSAVEDFMKPERVVVGTSSEKVKELMDILYAPYLRSGNPLIYMDVRSSELTKYASNAFLATKISFMNEMAQLCEIVGGNIDLIRKGMGTDSRIGNRFLFPGVGYGGSCFPKDVKALIHTSHEHGYNFKILEAVEKVNTIQKSHIVKKIVKYFGDLKQKQLALWGLAFKPNTDDIREAPSLVIINELLSLGAKIVAFDPVAIESYKKYYPHLPIQYTDNQYDALINSDALVIVTEWNEFRTPDYSLIKSSLKNPVIFDGRNILDTHILKKYGFYYESIGKPTIKPQ